MPERRSPRSRTENGGLCEASGAERNILENLLVKNVLRGRIRLIQQRRRLHSDCLRNRSRLQLRVHRGGAVALDKNVRVVRGLETLLNEVDLIGADGQVCDREGAVRLSTCCDFQIGCDGPCFDRRSR